MCSIEHFWSSNVLFLFSIFGVIIFVMHAGVSSLAVQDLTAIKFLTDGVLLREMMDDPLLTKYRYLLWF